MTPSRTAPKLSRRGRASVPKMDDDPDADKRQFQKEDLVSKDAYLKLPITKELIAEQGKEVDYAAIHKGANCTWHFAHNSTELEHCTHRISLCTLR